MSNALNLIIARGFPSPVQGALDSYNNQRQASEVSAANKINQQGAQINQQNAVQDQQWQGEDRQAAQAKAGRFEGLLSQVAEVDAALRQNPNDPAARQRAVELATQIEAMQKGTGVADILGIKPRNTTQAKPVMVSTPNGPVYMSAEDAVGQTPYIKQPAPAAVIQMRPPTGYTWKDPSNPSAGVDPLQGGPADPAAEQPVSPAEAAEKRKAAAAKADSLRVYGTYQTAMKGVSDALSNTTTGPIAGRMPAFSAEQQIAEGAVAAIAPILKQLFRAAGEGVFTDRDQQLLLDMVPTRTDRQQAKDAKITNINAIVASKLGIEQAPLPTKPPAEMSDAELMDALNGNP